LARHSVLHNFYGSTVYRKFRLAIIAERGPRCEECGEIVANTRELHLHHEVELTPDNVHDHTISLNPARVRLVCHRCHNKIHGRFNSRRERGVYLVYGPPLAGKQEYVDGQKMRGDLVVCMDRLYEAVSMQPAYDKPDNLFSNVIDIFNQLIDHIRTRRGKWINAWIIGGYPDKFKRERTADELGAELIYIEATKAECLARLESDPKLRQLQAEWRGYIEKWFEQYQP